MLETVRKVLLAGLGTLELTEEKLREVRRALRGRDVPTRRDLEALTRRVEALERRSRPPPQGVPEKDMDTEC